jgi:hypothetical protein
LEVFDSCGKAPLDRRSEWIDGRRRNGGGGLRGRRGVQIKYQESKSKTTMQKCKAGGEGIGGESGGRL